MFTPLITALADFIRSHMQEVSFGITAVAMMMAGPAINGILKRLTKKMNWFLRYLSYVLLCTAGYGFLSQVIYQGTRYWLRHLTSPMLIIWTLVIYLVLAWFAKQQKEI